MRRKITVVILALALIVGVFIGYVDSRPTWDDTGVTVGALLLASAFLSAVRPGWAWLVGLEVGAPVLAFNLAAHGNLESIVALAIGLVGAGLGRLVGMGFRGASGDQGVH